MVCVRWNYQAENRTNEMNSFCFGIGSDAMERVTRNLRPYTTSWWNVCALVRERERNVVSRSQRISLPFRYCCWWWTKRRLFLLLPFKYKCYCIFCSFSCHSTRELLSTTIHEFLVRYTVRSTNIHNRHRHTHTHSDRESHSALTKLFHSNRIKYANITDRKKWILSRWECHQRKTYRCFFLYLFAHNIVFTSLFTCTHTRWLWINLVSVGLSKEFLIRVMIINSKWIFLSLAQPILRISHIPNYDSFVRNFLLGCVLAAIKNICRSLTGYLF